MLPSSSPGPLAADLRIPDPMDWQGFILTSLRPGSPASSPFLVTRAVNNPGEGGAVS